MQVHEEFAYGISEQLLRSRAADQVCHAVQCPLGVPFNKLYLLPILQVSEKAHQTATEVQQKSKRITENVKQQVSPLLIMHS